MEGSDDVRFSSRLALRVKCYFLASICFFNYGDLNITELKQMKNQIKFSFLFFILFSFSLQAHPISLESLVSQSGGNIVLKNIGEQSIIEYTLSADVAENFNRALSEIDRDPYINWEFYRLFAQEVLLKLLPENLMQIIFCMRHSNKPTALLLHNAPIDDYIPPTPEDGHRSFEKGFVSEAFIFSICSLLDAYPEFDERERDGTMINQIIPRNDIKSIATHSSYGSRLDFDPHTENVYQEPPLKFFSLLCLRSDPKVATNVIFLDNILHYLKTHLPSGKSYEWMLEEMSKDQFYQKTGTSFLSHFHAVTGPILGRSKEGERVFRFNTNDNRTQGINDDALLVSEHLKAMIMRPDFKKQYYSKIVLQKGDFLMFNNWEIMHGRDAFEIDRSNWRWLQRCYFMLNEHRMISH